MERWEELMIARGDAARTVADRIRMIRAMAAGTGCDPVVADELAIRRWMRDQTWSAGTRATYHTYLLSWFGFLIAEGVRRDNPLASMKRPRVPRRHARPITDAHLRVLLDSRMHKRTRVMVMLAAYAGLRIHEVAKIRGEDVDLIGMEITVVGKGGVRDVVPLHPRLVPVAESMPEAGWWFPTYTGNRQGRGPILARSASTIVATAMRRAGIVDGGAHRLRHWFGTHLVEHGADLKTVQELLRHASLATTQVYVRVGDRQRRDAIALLDPWRVAA